jgi:hypothetical protein
LIEAALQRSWHCYQPSSGGFALAEVLRQNKNRQGHNAWQSTCLGKGFTMAQVCRRICAIAATAALLWTGASLRGDELLSGIAFRRAMSEPIGPITWAEKPLRGALERLVETQRVAIMLDRRIDPEQKLDISGNNISLENFVGTIARKQQAGVCQVGSVLYVGPTATTEILPTVVATLEDKAQNLPGDGKKRLLKRTAWNWPRLSTPRSLIDELEQDYAIQIQGKEHVPHDLWPATTLPPLNFVEKLSLVLAGFHVSFELAANDKAVRIIAMPKEASLVRSYSPRGDVQQLATQLAAQFPQANIRAEGKQIVVDGRWEVHDSVARLISGERVRATPPPIAGMKKFTLTVENKPVGGVMRALGTQLGKTVTFDDVKVQRRLTEEISLNLKDASLEELLRSVLTPANLQFEITGETIRVFD